MTKTHKWSRGSGVLAALAVSAMTWASAATAQTFAPSQIEMIIPYAEGGGSTIHGRLLAQPLANNLPGSPNILVRNVAGAGSIVGINEFSQTAKPDGLMIAALGTGTFFQYLLKNPAVRYELPTFRPFLASPFGIVIYGRTDFGLTGDSVADVKFLMSKPPVFGGDGPTAADLPILVALDLIGIKIKPVFGLANAESRAGYERGEFQLNFDNMASWSAGVEPMITEGSTVPLFTFGYEVNGEVVRDPMAPHVPTFLEVYEQVHGKPLSGIEYDVWKMLFDIRVMASKMFVLPAGTPDNIVEAYAKAMSDALDSDALKTDAALGVLGPYTQVTGSEAAAAVLRGAADVSDEQRTWLNNWLRDVYGIN
jgi:tripartite-type tricarboxylate transporter receptor subunit TctC